MDNCALPNCYPASYDINEDFDDVPAPIENISFKNHNTDLKKIFTDYRLASSYSAEKSANSPRCDIPGKQDPRLFEQDQDAGPALEASLVLNQGNAFENYPQTAPPLQRGDAKESANALLQKCPDGYKDVKMGSACQSKDDFFFKDGYMNENFENSMPVITTKRHSYTEEKDWKTRGYSEDKDNKHKLILGIPNMYLYIGISIILILIFIYYNFI